jgi:hypothetical protein
MARTHPSSFQQLEKVRNRNRSNKQTSAGANMDFSLEKEPMPQYISSHSSSELRYLTHPPFPGLQGPQLSDRGDGGVEGDPSRL